MNLAQMKYYKQQKGYSFLKLAELSGVPQGTIQKIFNGETKSPRYDTLKALERVLRPAEPDHVGEKGPSYMTGTNAVKDAGHTMEDYYALPEERRVELIDGVFYDMSAPSTHHQIMSFELGYQFRKYIDEKGGNCMPFMAPTDVQLDSDDRTMVQPDVVVLCDLRKLTGHCIVGAPDFVAEILSPATKNRDAFLKLVKYREAGVREYWMVDIEKERVVVYFFEEDDLPVIYSAADSIPVGIYEGKLQITMEDIFSKTRGMDG